MYLQNKYTKWYYSIITRAQKREYIGYTEKHHIIPRSLGGDNRPQNIAKLTPREHFICHLLLTKMTTGLFKYKMIHAVWQMSICNKNEKRYKSSSRIYEFLKIKRREIFKTREGNYHSNFRRKTGRTSETFTPEWKKKISEAKKNQNSGENNPMFGKNHTKETKSKISATRKIRSLDPTWNIRPPCSPEKANKIKQANLGKRWVHKPLTKERKYVSQEDFNTYCGNGWIPGLGVF